MIRNILTLVLILFSFFVQAQNTVGLLSYNPSKAYDGYNLMFPHNQPYVYLLNNCGEIVHIWEDDADYGPGNIAYLREDGKLVKGKRPASIAGNPIWAGGGGGTVEIRDWDNTLEWSYTINDSLARLHHDIAPMPNGNILMIVWELKSEDEAIQAGRDTALLAQDKLWPDYIIEVNPDNDEIVWEWHVWDHLIQDYDETKDNYGVVADHPELVNLNWDTNNGHPDWMHSNAIDYNPELDQIILSVPTFHEVWIIDHSTTTQEAAGHFGGLGNRGGDLLYRWGNPAAYDSGTEADQTLFYSHDIHWVDDFVDFMHPHFGKLAVFNNRVGEDFSTVNVFNPNFDMYENVYPFNGSVYEPAGFDWTLTHPEPTMMHSTGLSSVQLLPNGNALICVGRYGYSFEITPKDQIVWEYKTPFNGGASATQGDTLQINNNLTFRLKRYPSDFAAFEGKDLSAQGYIELEPNIDFCSNILPATQVFDEYNLTIFPNPASDILIVDWEAGPYQTVEFFDLHGRKIQSLMGNGGRKYVDISDWADGLYFIKVGDSKAEKFLIQK